VQRGTIGANPTLVATPASIRATFTGAASATLAFGDGRAQTLTGAATVLHKYQNQGSYTLTLTDPAGAILATATEVVGVEKALLSALPPVNVIGNSTTFVVVLQTPVGVAPEPVILSFGDGSSQMVSASGPFVHTCALVGKSTATVSESGTTLASAAVELQLTPPRIPLGTITAAQVMLPSVFAGTDTVIQITYSVHTPPGTFAPNTPDLEAVVDLYDRGGNVARHGDPFTIPYPPVSGGTQTATLPFRTPLGASGTYTALVYLQSGGDKIAVSNVLGLQILVPPDARPSSR
jgi:hypothetical protein